MNAFFLIIKKVSYIFISLILSCGLFTIVQSTPLAHADTTYTLKYFWNGGWQNDGPYQSLSDCESAMSAKRSQNHINSITCNPTDAGTTFYCYQVPINNNNGGYQKQCFTSEEECQFYSSEDAGNTNGKATCASQSTDDSGVYNGSINTPPAPKKQEYQFLAPLQNGNDTFTVSKDLPSYIQGMYRLLISLAGVIAVVMIVYGGILYMSTDAIGKKQTGKAIITRTLWGLALIIGSYVILVTINPTIVGLALPGSNGGALTPGSGGSGQKTDTSLTPQAPHFKYDISISNFGTTYPFDEIDPPLTDETAAACQADATANWSQPGGKNGYTYSASECLKETPPGSDNTDPFTSLNWCTNLSVNGKAAGEDCTGGAAYTIDSHLLDTLNAKIACTNDQSSKCVAKGDHATVVLDSNGEQYHINSSDQACFYVQHTNGLPQTEDCSTGGPFYVESTNSKNACETQITWWTNRPVTFEVGQCFDAHAQANQQQ